MIFYCPNCGKLEIGKVSYVDKDYIFTNSRDGYGLMLHNVICKECEYPLSAVVRDHKVTEENQEDVWYWKYIIEGYQNGLYAKKEKVLTFIKNLYEQGNRSCKQQVINACDKFLNE